MRNLIKKIPILNTVARWVWTMVHLNALVAQNQEAARYVSESRQHWIRLQSELQALQNDLVAMKQDLTALRQENAELRGLGIVVPRIEAQDEAIAKLREDVILHRDSAHQLHEQLRRQVSALSRQAQGLAAPSAEHA